MMVVRRGLYMMDFINNHFATIATLIGTLGGLIIGGTITSITQKNAENRKLKRERYFKALHIYNKFLEANGRTSITESFEPPVFQYELYVKEIRGILYEDLSCLHDDVYELVREIDYGLSQRDHFTEGSGDDVKMNMHLYGLYLNVYRTIEEHFHKKDFDL